MTMLVGNCHSLRSTCRNRFCYINVCTDVVVIGGLQIASKFNPVENHGLEAGYTGTKSRFLIMITLVNPLQKP